MMRRFPLFALIACAPVVASAGDEAGHWYVDPQIGAIVADRDRDTKRTEWLYGLGVGYNFTPAWSAEFNFNTSNLKNHFDAGSTRLYAYSIDILRVFNRDSVFAPYITAGAGAIRRAPSFDVSHNDFLTQAGFGAFIKLWENGNASSSFSLRPDFKARWDDTGITGHRLDYIGTLGFVLSFGPGKAAPVAAPLPPPPPPPPPAVPAPAPPPPPVAAQPSESEMVPQKGSVVLEGVNFELNSDVLTADSKPVLNKVAAGLLKHPRLKVELQGYTDSSGSAKYNLSLSDRRANSVRQYLMTQGVPGSQLIAKGYGKANPVADNSTPEGRAKNRRVVMMVLENPGDVTVKGAGEAQK